MQKKIPPLFQGWKIMLFEYVFRVNLIVKKKQSRFLSKILMLKKGDFTFLMKYIINQLTHDISIGCTPLLYTLQLCICLSQLSDDLHCLQS